MVANVDLMLEQTLRGSPILSSLTDEQLHDFLARAEILSFQLGDIIASTGELCDGLYFLLSGKIRLYIAGDGGHAVTREILSVPGGYWGAECWQRHSMWQVSARACAESTLVRITSEVVSSFARKSPVFQEQIQRECELSRNLDPPNSAIAARFDKGVQQSVDSSAHPQLEAPSPLRDGEPSLRLPVMAKLRRAFRRYPYISQQSSMDCGITCLAMIAMYYGRPASLRYLAQLADVTSFGTSMLALVEAADNIGFTARGFKTSYDGLMRMQLPAILH